jgi:hypothetical protein
MLYTGMLRRAPDEGGLDYWADTLGNGTPYRSAIAGFLGAVEYGNRIDRIYDQVHPLSGIATRSPVDRPALAVKIDNVSAALPQTGIEDADLVVEEMVEGSLTRLVAVFHQRMPSTVGPVRSIRTTDIDVLEALGRPLLAASGANGGVLDEVADAALVNVNALVVGGAYFRSRNRSAPHNLYARTANLLAADQGRGGRPPQLFAYRQAPAGAGEGASDGVGSVAEGVDINFGSTQVGFRWAATDRGWRRTQNGRPHLTAAGGQLSPRNVVVLEVAYTPSVVDARSPEAQTVGTGRAWAFTDGRVVTGSWHRASSEDPFDLRDDGDQVIELTPGTTFMELAPPGSVTIN